MKTAASTTRDRRGDLWILLCALAVSLPLALRGTTCGHDFDFHLETWIAAAQQWHQSLLYPHWFEPANYGAGEPRFVFYPPLSWMLGALLGTLMPWAATQFAFTFAVLAGCGFSLHKLAREWMPPNAATWAACAYMLNPYTLFVAYGRTAYGEFAAGVWLPLLVLFAVRLGSTTLATAASKSGNIIRLALTITAVWLTNAPAAVMACYFLASIVVWIAVARRRWKPVPEAAASVALGLGLASVYLVPAAYERRWVSIARAIGPDMQIRDSFLFTRTGTGFHDQVLALVSWIFVIMLGILIVSGGVAWTRGVPRRWILPIFAVAAAALMLQFPISLGVWNHAPELQFLQFAWRWSLVLGVAMAMAVGFAIASIKTCKLSGRQRQLTAIGLGALAVTLAFSAAHLFWQPCDAYDNVAAQLAVLRAGGGFQGTDEYDALGADNSEIEQELPPVRVVRKFDDEMIDGSKFTVPDDANPTFDPTDHVYAKGQIPAQIHIDRWRAEYKAFTVTSPEAGYALLRLMEYPAWRVRVNGIAAAGRSHRDDGLMAVPIPSGTTHITVTYGATKDVLWGRGLSAASGLFLLVIAVAGRKSRNVGYHV